MNHSMSCSHFLQDVNREVARIMRWLLIFIIYSVNMITYVRAKNCTISTATVQYVTSCPTDVLTWREAAKTKNCESLANFAVTEGCVKNPSDFVYHCVINHWMNGTLEVCAPTRYMQAFCVDFNAELSRLTENYEAACSSFKPPCPSRYISTDAYKYQGCYDIVRYRTITKGTTRTESTTAINPTTIKDDPLQTQIIVIGAVLVVCVVFILASILLLAFACWIQKLRKRIKDLREGSQNRSWELKTLIYEDVDLENQDVPFDNAQQHIAENKFQTTGIEELDLLDKTRLEEIKDQAKEHLESYREFDEYYVETSLYKKIQNCFRENGAVIIEGPAGCGKTAAATHLLFKYYELTGIDVLKATQFSDLYQYKSDGESSVIFLVDDLDADNPDLPNWITAFEMLYTKMKDAHEVNRKGAHRVRLVVTAFHIPSKLLHLRMFSKEFLIHVSELSKKEKLKILHRQMKYASAHLNIKYDPVDKDLQENVDTASTVVGFPLAAQMYAREEKYRNKGKEFFENPKIFFKDSLKEYIEKDKNRSILTALIIVYLREICERDGYIPKELVEAKLSSPRTCEEAINPVIVENLKLEYKEVSSSAKALLGLFFLKTEEGTYKFCHSLVLDSVSSYLFDEYFEIVVAHFPLAAIAYETHEFSNFGEKQFSLIGDRFIKDLKSGNMADVCKCTILKNEIFLKIMGKKLQENKVTLRETLTSFDSRHGRLPLTFWTGRYRLLEFSAMLLDFVDAHISNQQFINRYFSLLGEFSSKSPKDLNDTIHQIQDSSEIRKMLFAERPSFIHEIISSNRQDEAVKTILEHLIKDGMSLNTLDKNKRTPLMIAVYCDKERSLTIDLLLKKSDLTKVDGKGYSVFHHCVAAEKNDQRCSLILFKLLSGYREMRNIPTDVLNLESHSGLTVLHRAAIATKHSRILCMQILLDFDKGLCKNDMLDKTGRSPIYNIIKYLNRRSVFVELERLIRVCMLLLHGCSAYAKGEGDEKNAWDIIKEDKSGTHQKLFQLIKASPDEEEIIEIISSVLDDVPKNVERTDIHFETLVPNTSEHFSVSLLMLFRKAAQYLCTKTFTEV